MIERSCVQGPDDINVVLEQPEIDPGGIVVVKLAERAVLGQLLDFLDRAVNRKV